MRYKDFDATHDHSVFSFSNCIAGRETSQAYQATKQHVEKLIEGVNARDEQESSWNDLLFFPFLV